VSESSTEDVDQGRPADADAARWLAGWEPLTLMTVRQVGHGHARREA
jgi:hypothetical protein